MKLFNCSHCGQRVFFENVTCGACGSALGYVPEEQQIVSFTVEPDGSWQRRGSDGPAQQPCSNYNADGVCNWMVTVGSGAVQCISCSTTHTIPALSKPENLESWIALERAKRRLFYTLIDLKLGVPSKAADPANGLWFEFLEELDPGRRVLTGHDGGVITLNVAEADDAFRESTRKQMHEPYRTLLGHFRHESGHYYWDRLVDNSPWLDEFRQLFGDERADYASALAQHYAAPPADWAQRFISVYASSHPWEDWAECWAHYLHMVDGLDTAAAWGLQLQRAVPNGDPLTAIRVDASLDTVNDALVEHWLPVSQFVNAMNRSLGAHDSYPFVLLPSVIDKLNFIHRIVRASTAASIQAEAAAASQAAPALVDAAAPPPLAVAPAASPTAPSVAPSLASSPAPAGIAQ